MDLSDSSVKWTSGEIYVFLNDVERTCRSVCGNDLISIRLFGSAADGLFIPGTSDIDFMVIVNDKCPKDILDILNGELLKLEFKHNIADVRKVGGLQLAFDSRTAFFRSHFIFHLSTMQSPSYSKLVEETEAFELVGGKLVQHVLGVFVPWHLVFANVLSQSVVVFGYDGLTNPFRQIPWRSESRKDFLMTLGVSLLGSVQSLLSRDGTRTTLEALKWYLIGQASCKLKRRASLGKALELLGAARSNPFVRRFEVLRRKYESDRFFSLACPFVILHLQMATRKG